MPSKTDIIASLTAAPAPERLRELDGVAEILEVRADLVPDLPAGRLRQDFGGRLLYTLRSREEGGEGSSDASARRRKLVAAAREFDLVDLEHRDLEEETLGAIPPEQRLISWHGRPESPEELGDAARDSLSIPAWRYKLVTFVEQSGPDRWPLILLKQSARDDLIAFAAGETGTWTRLVAPHLGSPAVFASGHGPPAAAGQLTVERLIHDYRWPLAGPLRWLFGVVGNPVLESLSPYIHNRALRALDLPGLYLPFHVKHFGEFWLEVVEEGGFTEAGCSLRGLSVTAPSKRIAMAVAGATSPLVELIRSANTLVFRDGVWEADSTDAEGVLGPLRHHGISVRGRRCAVLGAGGAGRAAAYAVSSAGAEVVLYNRGQKRREEAVEALGLPCEPWEDLDPERFDLIVHATPLGRKRGDPLPCDPARLADDVVAIDLVYVRGHSTPWIRAVRECGGVGIDGHEVLLHQAVPQFAAMTGREMPADLVVELLAEMEAS